MFTDGAEGRYPATRKADGELHAPLLSDYRNVVDRNNLVELAAYTAPLLLGGEALGGYIAGTVSAEEALQACDEAMKSNKSETQIGDVVAHIERDLSREETVRYFADAFREYGGTDLCLMLPGGMADGQMHPYGISGKLYEGELHANELTVLLPNAGKPVPTLATARISGEDLRAVLESGRTFERKDASKEALAPFRYEVSGAEVDYDADGGVGREARPRVHCLQGRALTYCRPSCDGRQSEVRPGCRGSGRVPGRSRTQPSNSLRFAVHPPRTRRR